MSFLILRSSVSSGGGSSGGDNLFVADFSNLNANGSNLYNFANRATPGSNWTHTHLATGGRFGGPAARVTFLANRFQYECGWTTPSFSETWSVGDSRFMRFYMRIADDVRWTSDNAIKLIDDRGEDGGFGGERSILYFRGPYALSGGGGALGWQANVEAAGYPDTGIQNERVAPAWWGLSGDRGDWANDAEYAVYAHYGEFGCLTMNNEIGFRCCDPILVSYGNKTSCPANPNSTSQSSTGGWLEVQIEQVYATTNVTYFKQWINNNDYANPSSIIRVFNFPVEAAGLNGAGWNNGIDVIAYCDGGEIDHNENDLAIDLEAFEVGREFRDDWFRGT